MVHPLQYIFALSLILLTFWFLNTYKYFWSKPMSVSVKICITFIIDRTLALLLFLIKCSVCYEYYNRYPFWDGSVGSPSNKITLSISCLMTLNAVFTFFATDSNLFGPIFIICATITELGFISYVCNRLLSSNQQNKAILCGENTRLSPEETNWLNGLGFHISDQIGFGNYGTVSKCMNTITNRRMAMKVIDFKKFANQRHSDTEDAIHEAQGIRAKFREGIRKMSQLNNTNIVRLLRVEEKENANRMLSRIFLFSRLATCNLDYYLMRVSPHGVGEECARFWFRQLCDAVHYLHEVYSIGEPLPHSNIKPENILFFRRSQPENGIQFNVKLSDCGLNLFMPTIGKVTTRKNPIYFITPPKAVNGKKNLRICQNYRYRDKQNHICGDIYCLGLVLVFMIKGNIRNICSPPKDTQRIQKYVSEVDGIYAEFSAEAVKQLPGLMSQDLYDLLKKMLNRVQEFRIRINGVLAHQWLHFNANH